MFSFSQLVDKHLEISKLKFMTKHVVDTESIILFKKGYSYSYNKYTVFKMR